jgi:hypothetical protein
MAEPTDILGKIGKKVATEIKAVKDNITGISNISGNLSIGGNLTVLGETTTLQTATLEVEDNIIELNKTATGEKGADTAGIAVKLGTDPDATLIWDDTAAQKNWSFKKGTALADVSANIAAPDGDGVKINTVSVGDYASFETELNAILNP